jgi:hypothetical protein
MERIFSSRGQLIDFLSKHKWGYAKDEWRYILIYDDPRLKGLGFERFEKVARNGPRPTGGVRGFRLDTPLKIQIFLDRVLYPDLKGAIYIHTPLDSYLGF